VATALIFDERCLDHDNGSMLLDADAASMLDVPHAESAARLRRSFEVLSSAGATTEVEVRSSRPATEEEIGLVHAATHLETVRAACGSETIREIYDGAWAGPKSWEPILLAAGGAVLAVEIVLGGDTGSRAFSMLRPPGHHATASRAMGFCLLNNAAIAARVAQRSHGLERVAIVDWDVHHGNGTESIFADDGSVLFCSLHQDDLYPVGSGRVGDRGAGAGEGATINVPLPAGTGDQGYLAAVERVVAPALERFGPELVLVSAGQDPSAADPLGRMSVTADGFRAMAAGLASHADRLCDGRLAVIQEGGYSADHLPFCNLAILEAIAGLDPTFPTDPLELDTPSGVRAAEEEVIEAVRSVHGLR
jgi:acetoin utilization deacetylase AcuC-like enzyme